jgi:hypothetical protein
MSDFDKPCNELVAAMYDAEKLTQVYSSLMDELLRLPLWSLATPHGRRILWHHATVAAQYSSWKGAFASPGLYMFGDKSGVPLYIGKTEGTLRKRLFNRYVRGERSQCQLAATYQGALRERGIDGFPQEIREWYRRCFKGTARLDGAAAFAKHGINDIWVALIPVSNKSVVAPLEQCLIPVANQWNNKRGHPALLNKHYI